MHYALVARNKAKGHMDNILLVPDDRGILSRGADVEDMMGPGGPARTGGKKWKTGWRGIWYGYGSGGKVLRSTRGGGGWG